MLSKKQLISINMYYIHSSLNNLEDTINLFHLTGSENLKTSFFGGGHNFMNTLRYVIDVSGSETAHVDASFF